MSGDWSTTKPTATASSRHKVPITVGAGHRWSEVYAFMMPKGKLVVGGADPSVGIGGWLLGGGHSLISAKFGLGVDKTLAMEVVTPTGELVVASACENLDLFWAMRGGGGGGFGVLVSATFVAHADEPLTTATLTVNSTAADAMDNRSGKFWEAVAVLWVQVPALSAAGLMNQIRVTPFNGSTNSYARTAGSINDTTRLSLGASLQALSVSEDAVAAAMRPFLGYVAGAGPAALAVRFETRAAPSAVRGGAQFHAEAKLGTNDLIASRLLDHAGVANPRLPDVLRTVARLAGGVVGLMVPGPGVRARSVDDAAVTPAWRTA